MIRILIEPFQAGYMQRALMELILISSLAGVVGTHIVLRRMAFVTEAATHTVFPGVAASTTGGASPLAGGFASGLMASAAIAGLSRARRVRPDDATSIVLSTFFAVGVMIVSRRHSFASDLTHLFFGRLLTVNAAVLWQTGAIVAVTFASIALLQRWLVLRAFDQSSAAAAGVRVGALDLALHVLVVLAVVGALRAVGTLVALCLIIGPPATARLLRPSIKFMMVAGTVIGGVAAWIGIGLSYELSIHHGVSVSASAMVAATVTTVFVVVRIATAVAGHTLAHS